MVLQDLFDTLASGEFSNLYLGQGVSGSIREEAYPKIVNAINRSLLSLYKRFLLKKKKVYLVQQAGVTRYYLKTSYLGEAGATGVDKYLVSHPSENFIDDFIRVLEITDSDNLPVDINPPHPFVEQTYFKTAQFDALDLVSPLANKTYLVEFQAKYPSIVITEAFNPEIIELSYPSFIEEALIYHITYILVRGKTTKASEGEGYASNTWAARYEMACQELNLLGLAEEFCGAEDLRFNKRGFV